MSSDIDARSDTPQGFFYALGGSVLVSTNWVTAKYGLRGFNPETFSLVWISAASIYSLIVVLATGHRRQIVLPARVIRKVALMGLATGVGMILVWSGLAQLDPSFQAFLWRFQPVLTILLSALFLSERLTVNELVPVAAMVLGVFATVPLGELLEEHPEIEIDLVHGVYDRNMLFIKASIGKIEIDNMKRRMMMGRRAKAKQGKFPDGRAAYGYRYNPQTEQLEIDEKEAGIVKKVFSWYIQGAGAREVTRRLNNEGVPTKDHSRQGWNKSLVLSILRRKSYYLGETTFGDTVVPCPAIIDIGTWELAQRVKKQNTIHCRRNLQTTYLLRNLLCCEECGRRRYVKTKYRRRNRERYVSSRAYQCATSRDYTGLYEGCRSLIYLNADELEELVWSELDRLLGSPEMLGAGVRDQLAVMEEQVNEVKSRAGVLKKRLENLDRERQTVITWARTGTITEKDMALQLLDLEERQWAYQEDYERAVEIQAQEVEAFDAQRFAVEFCHRISHKLKWLSSEPLTEQKLKERRELAKILLHRVWINNKREIRIEGRIPQVEPDFEYALPR